MTGQAIKVTERIVDSLIRQVVTFDKSQFGFVPDRGTTDAIFVIRQLQEKYHGHREGVRQSSSESDLVGNEKAWC